MWPLTPYSSEISTKHRKGKVYVLGKVLYQQATETGITDISCCALLH